MDIFSWKNLDLSEPLGPKLSLTGAEMSSSVSFVIKRVFVQLLATFVVGMSPLLAADSAAKVTEAVNQVDHGSSQTSGTSPAPVGTVLQNGEYLKTGVKSRAELELADQSITRLGANTIFNYSVDTNEIDLQAGTILFSKPKDGKEMTIKTASVTAAVVGTTGFMQVHGHDFLFGLIEGRANVVVGGADPTITAGQILRFTPGAPPQIFSFNVPLLLKTSPLIILFHHQLPNQPYIDREVAEYDSLVARGFIGAPTQPYFVTDFGGFVPTLPILAHDSAGNALHLFNTPPPPPPPPPSNPFGSNGP
jgi:mannose-6-phosphate isomerase-like protein (cupin superfamily)